MSTSIARARKTDIYDDPAFDYSKFWEDRSYEHEAEAIALRRLLDGRRFRTAIDIGGGYGRLGALLADYADQVTVADPSTQQLVLAERVFPGRPPFGRYLADAAHLGFLDSSADLVTMVRVLHHLPDPEPESRGAVANPAAGRVRGRRGRQLRPRRPSHPRPPARPSSLRHPARHPFRGVQAPGTAPYVNHHPRAILRALAAVGLEPGRCCPSRTCGTHSPRRCCRRPPCWRWSAPCRVPWPALLRPERFFPHAKRQLPATVASARTKKGSIALAAPLNSVLAHRQALGRREFRPLCHAGTCHSGGWGAAALAAAFAADLAAARTLLSAVIGSRTHSAGRAAAIRLPR